MPGVDISLFYLPLGLIGLVRWSIWLFRRIVASRYQVYEGTFSTTLTVVTPVYQEDPEIFDHALRSWLADDAVTEVICVIDMTDTPCLAVAQRIADGDERVKIGQTSVPGKRDALWRGWSLATSEIVALVDSDTIWLPDVGREVLKPFGDPRIGAVATRQSVYRPKTLWQHLTDFYLDYRYFDELAAQTAWGQAISCVSGRTAVYRRSILVDIADDFMGERFLGVPCNSGDDKRLTTLTLERGHRTYLQRSAVVWSTFPEGHRMFFKQRLRWARNTWRSDLRALFRGWVFRHPFLAFTLIDKAIAPFTALLAPAFFLFAIVRGDFLAVAILLTWWLVSRGLKNLPHLKRKPEDGLLIPAFVVVSFLMALVRIQALATIRTQRWLTRDVAVVGGQLVRTNPQTDGSDHTVDLDLTRPPDVAELTPTSITASVGES